MKERPYDNRKARIEKKFSTEAMRLLMALMPRQYPADSFEMGWRYECRLDFDQWQVTTVDLGVRLTATMRFICFMTH